MLYFVCNVTLRHLKSAAEGDKWLTAAGRDLVINQPAVNMLNLRVGELVLVKRSNESDGKREWFAAKAMEAVGDGHYRCYALRKQRMNSRSRLSLSSSQVVICQIPLFVCCIQV